MYIYRALLMTLLISLTASLMAGGGWPQPKGKGYFKLSEWWLISDQHYTDAGLIDPNITTGIWNTSIYAEYGLTDRLTGVLYFPFLSKTYQNNLISSTTNEILRPGESITGIGDSELSLKYGILKGDGGLALSATATIGLPLGEDAGGSDGQLQLGSGALSQMLKIDAGTGWQAGKIPMYANTSIGFNNRTKGFSDEFRYGIEIGAQLANKKIWLIGRLVGVESLKNGETAINNNASSIFANNTEFLSVGGELAYNINENWGVSVSMMTATRGEIILASPSYSVGVFTRI
jgi:protein XagA